MSYLYSEKLSGKCDCRIAAPHSPFPFCSPVKTAPVSTMNSAYCSAAAILGSGFSLLSLAKKEKESTADETDTTLCLTVRPVQEFPEFHLKPAELNPGITCSVILHDLFKPSAAALEFNACRLDGFSCTVTAKLRELRPLYASRHGSRRGYQSGAGSISAGRIICIRNHQFNL